MKKGCFIEVVLWDRFSLLDFISNVKNPTLCIRYDRDYYVYVDKYPRFIKASKVKKVSYSERREVEYKKLVVAKIWIRDQIERKIEWKPKEFLEFYIGLLK